MKGYSKGGVGPFIHLHYNVLVEASLQGCSKGSMGPFILVHYNG
jgi:hypothetical protein